MNAITNTLLLWKIRKGEMPMSKLEGGVLRRFETEKFTENDYGYKEFGIRYNVQMLISLDGGKSWSYGGTGRFCKSEEEVRDYIGGFANERD